MKIVETVKFDTHIHIQGHPKNTYTGPHIAYIYRATHSTHIQGHS